MRKSHKSIIDSRYTNCLGNSIVVDVLEAIFEELINQGFIVGKEMHQTHLCLA
jgi:hypothetical protein